MSQTKAQLIDSSISPIIAAIGSAAAPAYSFTTDQNSGLYSPGADQVAISTGGTGRLFIDSSGRLLVGTSTARSNFFGTTLSSLTQTEGIGGSTARGSLSVINNDVSNNPPYVLLGRSGAATLGSNAVVVSGSRLGTLTFHGADGTSFIEAATVAGEVDGTPGSTDMPGRLVFSTTADGAASPTERMRITSAGFVGIGLPNPATQLSIYTNSAVTVSTTHGNTLGTWTSGVEGAGNFFIFSNDVKNILFSNSGSERARIDSSGRLLVGTSSSVWDGLVEAARVGGSQLVAHRYGANTFPSELNFLKSRGAAIGTNTIVADGDQLSIISSRGADGTTYISAASISAFVDGTPGTNDMPGRLVFNTTADGAASPTERMRITSAGFVGIGTVSPQNPLHVIGTGGGSAIRVSDSVNASINIRGDSGANSFLYFAETLVGERGIIGYQAGSGDLVYRSAANSFANGTERARIDSSGRLLVGTSTARSQFFNGVNIPKVQFEGVGLDGALAVINNFSSATNETAGLLVLGRAGASSVGSNTIVANGNYLGWLSFQGNDGTDFVEGAAIRGEVDGTPGANDMPGRLTFGTTADGAASPTERLRINSNGFATFTGSIGRGAPVTKTGNFTFAIAENWIICNGTATITATLPTASAWTGREIMLKTIAAFTVISASSNVVPLAGGAAGTAILAATAGRFATLVSDGTNWIIMQAN